MSSLEETLQKAIEWNEEANRKYQREFVSKQLNWLCEQYEKNQMTSPQIKQSSLEDQPSPRTFSAPQATLLELLTKYDEILEKEE